MIKIWEFQKDNGLHADGIIGIKTMTMFKDKFGLSNEQVANFIGQLHHETAGFSKDTESLNYSAKGLINTFDYYRKRQVEAWMDGRTAVSKARQETIANKVYMDVNRSPIHRLGNVYEGDGWKFRGRGAIMTTGRDNYEALGNFVKSNLTLKPELVASDYYWESAIFFFDRNHLWNLAEGMSIKSMTQLTKAINGGTNGLSERLILTRSYYSILANQN